MTTTGTGRAGNPTAQVSEEMPEGLHVEALPGLQPVEVAHGIACVALMLPKTGSHAAAATVLLPKGARELAALLLRQADAADGLLDAHSGAEATDAP